MTTHPSDLSMSPALLGLLIVAHYESARLHHEYIGLEHLVLALSREAGDSAPLRRLGVEQERVRDMTSELVGPGLSGPSHYFDRPYTTRTIRSFSLAADCARELGHAQITVGDLIVGVLREGRNIGAQVLRHEGLTLERALEYAEA